jgi:hypothetical protein
VKEKAEIAKQRSKAAEILREHKAELIGGWMEKIRLLTREKGLEGLAEEQVLEDGANEFVEMLLRRLAGKGLEADVGAFYHLVLEGRQNNVRLADVAYILLELKSVAKQTIFENLDDELAAFRVSRLVDDTVEAVLRKTADLYELTTEADHLTARERLQEIFAAWDIEESVADVETPAAVLQSAAVRLGGIWKLMGCRARFGEPPAEALDLAVGPGLPIPAMKEQRHYLTEGELAAGGVVSVLDRVCRRRDAYISGDVRHDHRIVNGADLAEAGVRSIACCPFISRDKVMGALLLYAEKPHTFQKSDSRRLSDFANVLALALERTGRLERSRKEISEAEVVTRIGRSLLELPTREALLQGVVEALRVFRDYFDVSLFRVDHEKGECVLTAEAGRGRRYRPDEYRQKIGMGFIGLCAQTGETIRASDLEEDARRLIAFEEEYRARSELVVPVKKGSTVLGVIDFLSEREEDFPEADMAALHNVSPHIGVALQNASMIVQRRHDRYEIEQAHRQLANIIRSAAVGITSIDTNGVYTHWSQSCEAMLGYAEAEVVQRKTPADFAADPYELRSALGKCLREGRTDAERVMLRKDGSARVVRESCVPVRDEEGRHIGFTSYLVDITEQKRADEELRRERDTLNLVVGAMGAGLALFDRDLRMHWANATMVKWFGLGQEAFGRDCHEINICGTCKPDTCPVIQATTTGLPQSPVHEVTDASGAWHCYQQVFTPVAYGQTRLVVLTLDVTDQRRQTEQMRRINKLTEKVATSLDLEKVLHLVLTCVTAGHAIGFNRAFIFLADERAPNLKGTMAIGPTSAADAHRIWSDLAQKAPSIEELLDSAVPSPSDLLLTERVRSLAIPLHEQKDMLANVFHSRAVAHVRDARSNANLNATVAEQLELEEFVCVPLAVQDEPLGVMLADNKYSRMPIDQEHVELLGLFSRQASLAIANARAYEKISDQLEELQRTRDRLIEAERMASVGRMASHMAHEIRNPLTAMGGFAAAIARQHQNDPKTSRNAMIIYEEARRLERTLINVLDYTRPLRPKKEAVSLNALVLETVEQFGPQLKEDNISLRMSLGENLPEVPADAAMVKQVVINLLKNAVEAMESKNGGTLTIATSPGEREVELLVADTGVGMGADTVSKLFSPFFTTKIGGIGLGLSVSRRIVEQHGGRISVESKLGDGSRFIVTLALLVVAGDLAAGVAQLGEHQ